MRVLGIVGVIFLVIIGIPVTWLGSAILFQLWNSYSHSFRLTIEVETPDGVKTGASVIRATISEQASWVPVAGTITTSVSGEAVFVNLGTNRNVTATLTFGPIGHDDRIAYLAMRSIGDRRQSWYRQAARVQGRADLTGPLIPTLVTFSDPKNPATVRVVDSEKFEQEFGVGFRFQRAFIEMVPGGWWPFTALGWPRRLAGEPVTREIETKLPWLARMRAEGRGDRIDTHPGRFTVNAPYFIRD